MKPWPSHINLIRAAESSPTDRAFDANAREWTIAALVFCLIAALAIIGAALGGLL